MADATFILEERDEKVEFFVEAVKPGTPIVFDSGLSRKVPFVIMRNGTQVDAGEIPENDVETHPAPTQAGHYDIDFEVGISSSSIHKLRLEIDPKGKDQAEIRLFEDAGVVKSAVVLRVDVPGNEVVARIDNHTGNEVCLSVAPRGGPLSCPPQDVKDFPVPKPIDPTKRITLTIMPCLDEAKAKPRIVQIGGTGQGEIILIV